MLDNSEPTISFFLLQCKPEQVQAIRDSERRDRRDQYLEYEAGDIISVLEGRIRYY